MNSPRLFFGLKSMYENYFFCPIKNAERESSEGVVGSRSVSPYKRAGIERRNSTERDRGRVEALRRLKKTKNEVHNASKVGAVGILPWARVTSDVTPQSHTNLNFTL